VVDGSPSIGNGFAVSYERDPIVHCAFIVRVDILSLPHWSLAYESSVPTHADTHEHPL